MNAGQARLRLRLPPVDRMMVDRLVFDQTGRWPNRDPGHRLTYPGRRGARSVR
jgi:hypothetical protein